MCGNFLSLLSAISKHFLVPYLGTAQCHIQALPSAISMHCVLPYCLKPYLTLHSASEWGTIHIIPNILKIYSRLVHFFCIIHHYNTICKKIGLVLTDHVHIPCPISTRVPQKLLKITVLALKIKISKFHQALTITMHYSSVTVLCTTFQARCCPVLFIYENLKGF